MTTPYGQNAEYGIAFQNSFDLVASVNSVHFFEIISESVAKKIPPLISQGMRGRFDEGDSYEGPHMNEGDIEIESSSHALGVLLTAMFEETVLVTSGSVYTRTFQPRTEDWDEKSAQQPFTFYKGLGAGSAHLFTNMNASELELKITNGEFFMAKMSVTGGGFARNAETTASYVSEKNWTWDTASFSIGGSANADVEQLTIKVTENVEPKYTLENRKDPSHTKRGSEFRAISVEGTIKFTNQTEFNEYLNQSERPLTLNFRGVTAIQSGYYEEFGIELPLMRYDDFPITGSGPGEMTAAFTGRGKFSVSSGTAISFTHRSSVAAYK